jgi:hypothetical protein
MVTIRHPNLLAAEYTGVSVRQSQGTLQVENGHVIGFLEVLDWHDNNKA